MIHLAHKIELDHTYKQAVYFAQACGVARFSYNWALAEWQKQYKAEDKPNEAKLQKALNEVKRAEFPWMLDVTKCAPQQALKIWDQLLSVSSRSKVNTHSLRKKVCMTPSGLIMDLKTSIVMLSKF